MQCFPLLYPPPFTLFIRSIFSTVFLPGSTLAQAEIGHCFGVTGQGGEAPIAISHTSAGAGGFGRLLLEQDAVFQGPLWLGWLLRRLEGEEWRGGRTT